jgi:hypothetical protein
MLYNTVFSQMLNVFEYHFNGVCVTFISDSTITESSSNWTIKDTKRHWKDYIIDIPFPVDDTTWEEITYYKKLRNLIVHHNSRLNKDYKYAEYIARKFKKASVADLPIKIEISYDLLILVGKEYKKFFQRIRKSLRS